MPAREMDGHVSRLDLLELASVEVEASRQRNQNKGKYGMLLSGHVWEPMQAMPQWKESVSVLRFRL